MKSPHLETRIATLRAFNRFYTQHIGVLNERLLKTPFSLAEGRVLYELTHREGLTAAALAKELNLDPAYLSRILANLKKQGLLKTQPGATDRRAKTLTLTPKGHKAYEPLNAASNDDMANLLAKLPETKQRELVQAVKKVHDILAPEQTKTTEPFIIRPHRSGDIGWIVHRHGALYRQEYNLDETFEGLVATVAGEFLLNFDPKKEYCWVAEREGEIVGSVFLVKQSDTVGKLRLLYVEPSARGLGIGKKLVEECLRFARHVGYKRVVLWTQNNLKSARRIYEAAGFKLVNEEKASKFGVNFVGQNWELKLNSLTR